METITSNNVKQLDQHNLTAIYERYSPALFRYAIRMLDDNHLAEDCVSETFSRFLRAVKNANGIPVNVQAYLFRIASNWITDQYRRKPPPMLPLQDHLVVDNQANPSQLVAAELERQRIRTALLQLTQEQREVIVLRFLEGWSHEEIAVSLDRSVEATRALQMRALIALRRILGPKEESSHEPG